ncbi:hypothetical protein G4B88_014902 [Cannabis sativa]|uniref:Uncharacterized protein n=1 Tax=Cannabis sativa TaxID=3483 RepID=A0A7J6IAX7_CANSA|nr:hypothetical protein G4B88_014902 [Cannabis sativa]
MLLKRHWLSLRPLTPTLQILNVLKSDINSNTTIDNDRFLSLHESKVQLNEIEVNINGALFGSVGRFRMSFLARNNIGGYILEAFTVEKRVRSRGLGSSLSPGPGSEVKFRFESKSKGQDDKDLSQNVSSFYFLMKNKNNMKYLFFLEDGWTHLRCHYHWFSRFLARTLQTLDVLIKSDINSNSAVDHDGLLFLHDRHHFNFPTHSHGTTQSQYSKSQLIAVLVNIIWQLSRTQPNNDIINSFGGHGFGLALRNDNLCYGGSTVGEVEGGDFELVGPEIGVLDPNLG